MGRVLLTIPENVSDFLKVGSSFRVEFFKVSTFATAGATSTTVQVDDSSGFAKGDHIYIGTNSALITDTPIIITSLTSTSITVGQSFTWANNDSVLLKRDVSADNANDNYATFYDDPDFATAYTGGQPISVDSDNQVFGFMPPGRYGMRWSTATATVEAHHHITFDEVTGVQVTNSNSATAGIQEAINATPSGAGVVRIGQGTFTMATGVTLTAGVTLQGAGRDVTTLKLADSTTLATTVGGVPCLIGADGLAGPVTIQDLTIDMNKANNTGGNNSAIVIKDVSDPIVQRIRIKDQSNTAAGAAYSILVLADSALTKVLVDQVQLTGIGDVADGANATHGIWIDNPFGYITVSNCRIEDCDDATGSAIHLGQGGTGVSDLISATDNRIWSWGASGSNNLQNGIAVEDATRVNIVGNAVYAVNGHGFNILNDGGAAQGTITITGNQATANHNGLYLNGANLVRVLVSGNTFSLNGGDAGVLIDGPSDVSVVGNNLEFNAHGVRVTNSEDVYIAGNRMLDNTTQAIKDNGTNTRLNIGYNVTGITDETAMSGTDVLVTGSPSTVAIGSTNPYIRASNGCMISFGYAAAAAAAAPLVMTALTDGTFTLTGPNTVTTAIWWKILEVDETG